ncbi:MAG: hypothetical protein M3P30_15905 [Chloroflexota bacterium]|nr:hypothetical protein [Chloroflexota bacterium]
MGRSRQLGTILMAAAGLNALLMVIGTMRRSYLAVAVPVLAATSLISALAFWVGWTMMNTEPDLAELEEREFVPTAV